MMKHVMAAAAMVALMATAAPAQDEPQQVRQQMMKQVGGALGAIGAIAKGEKPFDAEVVKASLTTMAEVGKSFPEQFPAGSEAGFETEASPKIWENMADFTAKSHDMQAAAEQQLAAMPADASGIPAVMKAVGASCGACHETYRLKK